MTDALKTRKGVAGPQDWTTDRNVFNAIDKHFRFTLDAACQEHNCMCENGLMYPEHDALTEDWVPPKGGSVWLNPPYTRGVINQFMERAYTQSRKRKITVVAITHVCTDVSWFKDWIWGKASAIWLFTNRLPFWRVKDGQIVSGKSHLPHMLSIYRPVPSYESVWTRVLAWDWKNDRHI